MMIWTRGQRSRRTRRRRPGVDAGNGRALIFVQKSKMLIGSEASLQHNCNMEGFNVLFTFISNSKARIAIVSNNNNDCRYCDSRIGFETGCSSSPTVAGFSFLCFGPAFLAKCYRSFRQYFSVVCSVCFPAMYLGLSPSYFLPQLFLLFLFLYFSPCFVRCCMFAVCLLFFPFRHVFYFV